MTLFSIKDYLEYITEAFAALLDLDFTIIDANPIRRVTGTGYYKHADAKNAEWPFSYTRQVIESGTPMCVIDTADYRALRREMIGEDDTLANFEFYSIILQPVISNETAIGAIVIASFTETQKQLLIQKKDSLMEYLNCIAELIELKLTQEDLHAQTEFERNQLHLIYENMTNGVVLMKDCGIVRMNSLAEKLLFHEWPQLFDLYVKDLRELCKKATASGEIQRTELYHVYEGHSKILTARAIPLNNDDHNVVCMIMPFIQTQEEILQTEQGDVTELVAANKEMLHLIKQIRTVALYDSNVLITGESGTGKEMVARMLHTSSKRKDKPFVSINCAAIPETLLESELFGYEGGAFTGASKGGKIGKFMLANNGTLFLDEIGDMPLYLQAKLLRAISERKIDRIGSEQPIDVDVRIIAATNRNLEKMIREQTFREDLFYRLSVIPFMIPPLRERREDIVPLSKHFINKYNDRLQKQITGISNAVMEVFLSYDWPGNVRELENSIEYMMNFEPSSILSIDSLPMRLRQPKASAGGKKISYGITTGTLKERMAQYEKNLFLEFLELHGGRPKLPEIDAFCKELKISRATYYRKQAEAQHGGNPDAQN